MTNTGNKVVTNSCDKVDGFGGQSKVVRERFFSKIYLYGEFVSISTLHEHLKNGLLGGSTIDLYIFSLHLDLLLL